MHVLESKVERLVVQYCESHDILCEKLVLASMAGWPDRTLLYRGQVMFLELKRPGERPSPLQQYVLDGLTRKGFHARWADNADKATHIIHNWKKHVDSHTI